MFGIRCRRVISRVRHMITEFVPIKPYCIKSDQGLVSFTFDDIPHTAAAAGGAILSRHGVAGTYYVCGGLTGAKEQGIPCHSRADLEALARDGHELGVHTFRHLSVPSLSKTEFDHEAHESDAFIRSIVAGAQVASFAYPFGRCNLRSKRWAAKRYATARGISPGFNEGWTDLAQLKAVPLYSGRIDEAGVRAMVKQAIARKAWLIFYTHDVSDSPSPYGCTAALLETAVHHATVLGACILPVKSALDAIAAGRHKLPRVHG